MRLCTRLHQQSGRIAAWARVRHGVGERSGCDQRVSRTPTGEFDPATNAGSDARAGGGAIRPPFHLDIVEETRAAAAGGLTTIFGTVKACVTGASTERTPDHYLWRYL